ncbi:hypothetical protein ABZ383_25040 [Streptomyces sp. NPDC005900]|uniref:hypothetical protein n=1 Tax=unclassified Streptomyces TaxID=2593676 RepID=UPI00340190B6
MVADFLVADIAHVPGRMSGLLEADSTANAVLRYEAFDFVRNRCFDTVGREEGQCGESALEEIAARTLQAVFLDIPDQVFREGLNEAPDPLVRSHDQLPT